MRRWRKIGSAEASPSQFSDTLTQVNQRYFRALSEFVRFDQQQSSALHRAWSILGRSASLPSIIGENDTN
jgi:hypothetical protein